MNPPRHPEGSDPNRCNPTHSRAANSTSRATDGGPAQPTKSTRTARPRVAAVAISGERRKEEEEKGDQFYRCEREYGSFQRAVPLPEGVKLEDVKATFADGVLEVSVPLPAKPEAAVRKVAIEEPPKAKAAA